MVDKNKKANQHSSDFMLEEFRFLKTSYEGAMTWRDERFKHFLNIVFGLLALITIVSQFSENGSELFYAILIISVILYLYGWFIFSRLVSSYFSIERMKQAINKVRKYFVDMDEDLLGYLLVPIEAPQKGIREHKLGTACWEQLH